LINKKKKLFLFPLPELGGVGIERASVGNLMIERFMEKPGS